jgi:uncharacterized membrane protein
VTTRSAIPTGSEIRAAGTLEGRRLGWLLLISRTVGFVAAFVLAVEKYVLLANPSYVPSCSINPVLSCGSIMSSPYTQALGFPNPLIGVAGFTVVIVTGALFTGGTAMPRWYWTGLQIGATAGVLFVHWLIFVSLYRIGALCPYCMAVWVVTVLVFWYVTMCNLTGVTAGRSKSVNTLSSYDPIVVVVVWLLTVTALTLQTFCLYWQTVLPLLRSLNHTPPTGPWAVAPDLLGLNRPRSEPGAVHNPRGVREGL